jgi:hypothetical protein
VVYIFLIQANSDDGCTGGGRVGRIVAEAAAKHLTPVSLEVRSTLLTNVFIGSVNSLTIRTFYLGVNSILTIILYDR